MSADDLCADLLNLPFFKSNPAIAAELKKANSVNEIFIVLTSVCSFWDYDIFEFLIFEYELDQKHQKLHYAQHFDSFIGKHKVSEFTLINPALVKYDCESGDSKKLTLKFDIDIVDCCLTKVNELKEVIAAALNINHSALRLLSIQEGCMEVTFLIPTVRANVVFADDWKLVSDKSKDLQASSLITMSYGNTCFNTREKKLVTAQQKKEGIVPPVTEVDSCSK